MTADPVSAKDASGVSIPFAFDDAGADGRVQIIKLAVDTDGSATVLPAHATYGLSADVKRLLGITALGQTTKAGAIPVTLASNEDLLAYVDGLEGALAALLQFGQLPASLGAKARAASLGVTLSTEDQALIDGLEGLLAGGLPATLGRKAAAASLAVVLSTEDSAFVDGLETALATLHTDVATLHTDLTTGVVHVAASVGESTYTFLSTAAVLAANIKASAGLLTGYSFFKKAAGTAYVRFYDKATAPTSGDTPVRRVWVPGSTAGDNGGVERVFVNGMNFVNGIGIRVTGAVGDSDTTALSANDVIGNVDYV